MKLRTLLPYLALGVAMALVAWVLTRPPPPRGDAGADLANLQPRSTGSSAGTSPAGGTLPGRAGSTQETPASPAANAHPGGHTTVVGSREPFGIDLSDPRAVHGALVAALGKAPRDWSAVRRLLELYKEPLDSDVRETLLQALRGPDREPAREALANAQDPTLVGDLFALFDDPEAAGDLRTAVLDVLARMPGAPASDVVLGLESRLRNDPMADAPLLRAIARRGGEEAARAVVEYLQRSSDPLRVPGRLAMGQALRKDPKAMAVVARGLEDATRSDVVVALTGIAAVPGADALVPALIHLDTSDRPDELRRAALDALAQIGSPEALDHLLQASRESGPTGEDALRAIGRMDSAGPKTREMLMAALEDAARQPRPIQAKRELLSALANLGHEAAAPAFRDALTDPDDRIRQSAALGIGRLGRRGRPYVEDLVRAYASSERRVQRILVQALGMVGGDEARSVLEQMKSDEGLSPDIQRAVVAALQRLPVGGEPPSTAEEKLRGAGGR